MDDRIANWSLQELGTLVKEFKDDNGNIKYKTDIHIWFSESNVIFDTHKDALDYIVEWQQFDKRMLKDIYDRDDASLAAALYALKENSDQ